MEALTIYRVKGKDIGLEFLFKYDLNGNLKAFEIVEGELEENQINWLFKGYLPKETTDPLPFNSKKGLNQYLMIRFPASEIMFQVFWLKNKEMIQKFDIEKAPPIITFDMAWELFGNKIKKFESQDRWKKATEAQRIKIVTSIPGYKKYLDRKGVSQTNLATYIHKRYYEDDWNKA